MTSKAQPELTAIAEKAGDELQIHYVSLSSLADKLLQGNSKKHDLGTLSESVNRYSFRDPIAFDSTLNGGAGGIVEGNGRLEWAFHARDAAQPAPRGIKVAQDDWYLPVIFGVNAENEAEGVAYSISHNLSPMWGSDLTFLDQTRLFDEDKLKVQLVGLAELSPDILPIGLDGNDLDLWLGMSDAPQEPLEDEPKKEEDDQVYENKYGVLIECADATHQEEVYNLIIGQGYECKILTV
jgi:hypothetical protein